MCWAAGEESVREAMHMEIVVGTFYPNVASFTSIHTGEMVDVVDSFVTYDYATLMKLGSLDINGLCQLCADEDNGGAGPIGTSKVIVLDGGMGM
ncbi:unnamed protein product [Lactuca virosa]|uniref:Uncharacterized protein n=1 Tax=Lactuca virosa TaxID=75947 RepID=A0AAU9MMK2_9ASTR|nr:unnamed protein product [Lactuca virosa]